MIRSDFTLYKITLIDKETEVVYKRFLYEKTGKFLYWWKQHSTNETHTAVYIVQAWERTETGWKKLTDEEIQSLQEKR